MADTAGPWVDSHCHLFLIDADVAAVLDDAVSSGVQWVLCPGIDLGTSLAARRLAGEHPRRVLWSAGLHPHELGVRQQGASNRSAAPSGRPSGVGRGSG